MLTWTYQTNGCQPVPFCRMLLNSMVPMDIAVAAVVLGCVLRDPIYMDKHPATDYAAISGGR